MAATRSNHRRFSWISVALLALLFAPTAPLFAADIWVLIDTGALTLEVRDGERTVLAFSGIAIGRGGTVRDKRRGDDKTPLGRYNVAWINRGSRFRAFIGIDYPRRPQVERAFRAGAIDATQRGRMLDAIYHGKLPPQNTPLGGYLGIHGLGSGNPRLHAMANWTEGCVALTNEQVDRLLRWVEVGTPILIR